MMSCIGPIVTVGNLAPRAQHAVTKNAAMRAFFSGMEVEFWILTVASRHDGRQGREPQIRSTKAEGLRERNRRETLQRIADVAMELFVVNGYEATTLDEIAASAGISRRTFFHYFKSKDDLLLAHLEGYSEALKAAVLKHSTTAAPIDVVQDAITELSARFGSARTIAIVRVIRQSETLRARKQHSYLGREQVLFEGLCELWPAKERRERLRLVAMAAMGVVRLAVEAWLEQNGKRPLAKYIQDGFKNLKAEI
jgi:AcrR family transcriptional regulator